MSKKPLCLACFARPVHCVAMAPLCGECDPHTDWGGLTYEEHARRCPPCRVFLVWITLEDFPNTATDLRSERVRRVFATGSPLSDEERALLA